MVVLFWNHSSGTQSKSRQCRAFPTPAQLPQEFGAGWRLRARYSTTSLISMNSKSWGWGGGEKRGRESHELLNLGFQSNPEEASVPDCSLSFVWSALGCLQNEPTLVFQAQNHLLQHNHSFTSPRKVPCGERLSFALARGIMTLRVSPWCKWKTPEKREKRDAQ